MQPTVPPSVNLDPGEKVLRKVNRYWTDLMPSAASATVLIIAALGIAYGYGRYRSSVSFINGGWVAILVLLFLGLGCLILFVSIWVYRQNCLILTNMHLIQVVQSGLFNRQISQLSLSKVQDVTAKRSGMMATLLNFGDVVVQTAGERDEFAFRNAPAPQELAEACLEAHEQFVNAGSTPPVLAPAGPEAMPLPTPAEPPVQPPVVPVPAEPMPLAPAAAPEPPAQPAPAAAEPEPPVQPAPAIPEPVVSQPEPTPSAEEPAPIAAEPAPVPASEPAAAPQGPQTLEPGETASLSEFGAAHHEDDEDEL